MLRMRPIRNLWFKFIQGSHLENKVSAEDVAECLMHRQLITVLKNKNAKDRYIESELLQKFMREEIWLMVEQYLADKNTSGGKYGT